MRFEKKWVSFFLSVTTILSCYFVVTFFYSDFSPSYYGVLLGVFSSFIILLIMFYEIKSCGDRYLKNTKKMTKFQIAIIFLFHLIGYSILGIYGFSRYGNYLIGRDYSAPKYIYLYGKTGYRMSICSNSATIVDINDGSDRDRYCLSRKHYQGIKKIRISNEYGRPRVVLVTYRESFLGSEVISIKY